MAQALHLSPQEARQLRRSSAGAAAGRSSGAVAVAEAPDREAEACRETLECITDELQMCLRYYATMFPDRAVDRLVFIGGEARHRDTCQVIARALRLPAQLGDPLGRLARSGRSEAGPDFTQPQPGWAVALGLCLSETDA
jgi:Tfp pilus assembly PilM family ATPase